MSLRNAMSTLFAIVAPLLIVSDATAQCGLTQNGSTPCNVAVATTNAPIQALQVYGHTVLRNEADPFNLNDAFFVYNTASSGWGTNNYGMMLGFNYHDNGTWQDGSGRYRTLIFAPDAADIAFGNHPTNVVPIYQRSFLERLVIRGDGPTHTAKIGIANNNPQAALDIFSATQLSERIRLSGQEFVSSSNSDTNGVSFLLGVNRSQNRQLWLVDSATASGATSTIAGIRFQIGSGAVPVVEGVSTDGNAKDLQLGTSANVGIGTVPSGFKLNVAGTAYISSNVTIGGALTANSGTTTLATLSAGNTTIAGTATLQSGFSAAASSSITGNLTVSGTIQGGTVVGAVYQDIAEWVPASQSLAPGTVVVLDATKNNEVIASSKAYDTAVAGVVSAQPGVILGKAADSKSMIATVGRVRVKIDATQNPVHVGDLLVTSDTPGMAMVSTPVDIGGVKIHRPGTLIGKALEPLASGKGDVLVLLSLQ